MNQAWYLVCTTTIERWSKRCFELLWKLIWKSSEVSERRQFSCWGLNAPAQSQHIPQIKSSVRGEEASDGKRGLERRDGLGRGPCECSLFWRGDNLSISTGQSCQSTPRRGPWHPLRFFICPVEGTSIQWQSLPPAFDEKLRRDIWAHLGKGLSFALSAKWLYYLPALESWGEGSPGYFGKAKTTLALQ